MINIGGVNVIPKDGFTIDRNKLEERDSGQLSTFNTRAERFEPYDLVTIEGIDEQFVVQSDNVIRLRDGLYEHDITLVEAISTFDGFYPADRIFSADPPKTLGQVLTIYKTELSKYHNLEITFDTEAEWTNTFIRQKEFVGVNFSIIVSDLFRTIDAKPRARFDDGEWEIYPDFYNERRNLITPNPVSDLLAQDSLDYATKVKTQIKNGTYESQKEKFFPSSNGAVFPKSDSVQRITSKLQYELDSSIIDIVEVKVFNVNVRGDFASQPVNKTFTEVDITEHVLPKPFWDGIKTEANQKAEGVHKKNSLFFDIGGRAIKNLFNSEEEGILWDKQNISPLRNAIVASLYEQNADFPLLNGGMQDEPITEFTCTTLEKDISMRVKYTPQRSFDLIHHRQFIKNMNEITQIHKQRDSQTEVERYKNVLKNLSNRMGNDVRQFTQVFTDTAPFNLGDYDVNDNVIIRVKNTFYNDYTLCEFLMAEGFGNIDGEASLFKEPSPFEILSKDITTNLIFEEFIEVSETSKAVSTRLNADGQLNVLATLDSSITPNPPIQAAVMQPIVSSATLVSASGVYLPAFTGGGGNTTSFHFQIDNQISAGRAFSDTFDDPTIGLDLVYTEPDTSARFGELDDFFIYLIPDVDISDDGFYPLIPAADVNSIKGDSLTLTNIVDTINKDKNAKFAVTFQQHFITDDPNIIIGAAFAKYNRLFSSETLPAKKIYRSDKPYSIFDNKVRVTDTLVGGGFSVDTETRKLTVSANAVGLTIGDNKHVAITYNDEIILAFNDFTSANREYFINFTDAAEREVVNQLPIPSSFGSSSTADSLSFALTNLSSEGVTIEATLDGVTKTEQVGGNDGDPLNIAQYTATFSFTGLTNPNTSYPLTYRALPLAGSELAPSTFGIATAKTSILPTNIPTFVEKNFQLLPNESNRINATYTVTNTNPFDVEVFARVNGFEYSVGTLSANSSGDVVVNLSDDNQFIFEDISYTIDMRFETTTFLNNWYSDYTDVETLLIQQHAVPSFVSSSATDVTTTWVWRNESDFTSEIEIDLFAEASGINVFIERKSAFALSGLTATVTFTGLDPETTYKTTAKALQRGFKTDSDLSGFSPTRTTLQPTTTQPTISIGTRTVNSIQFTFTNQDAANVDIYWNLTGNPGINDNVISSVAPSATATATATGLDSGTTYTIFWRAQAANKLISSIGQSTTGTLRQLTKPTFITSSVTTSSITAQWGNPNNVPVVMQTTLQIGASPVPNTTITTNIGANGGASVFYDGLGHNATYNIVAKFLADNDSVESPTENSGTITTQQKVTANPTVVINSTTATSVNFTMTNNDDLDATFEYGVALPLGQHPAAVIAPNGSLTRGISSLDSDTAYTLQVKATVNTYLPSEVIEIPFTTDPAPVPTQWVFRSATTPNETLNRGFVPTACPTSSSNLTYLNGQIDPSTKPFGYVVRVTSSSESGGFPTECTAHHYEAQ